MSGGAVGVVGAGTMGAGIAQLACLGGRETLVHDPVLDEGTVRAKIERDLDRGAERRRWPREEADAARGRLRWAEQLGDLADCEVVIEAAPERLELKRDLFGALAEVVAGDAVLATNTSSIPVTAVARDVPNPQRVVGMHFFNPAPLMRLVEVVAGAASDEASLARARRLGQDMGRRVIDAADGPGFLVNRCARPFGLEAVRLLQDRIADVETIDRIVRLGGRFRMGPFELQDLVGIDTGMEVARSFYAQSFGEPRWRPSPLSERMVAAGWHGRKTGRGWYRYDDGHPQRAEDPPAPRLGEGADGLVVIAGDVPLAYQLGSLADDAGWDVRDPYEAEGMTPDLILDLGADPEDPPLQGGPQAILVAQGSLAQLDPGGGAIGFHALPPLEPGGLVELTRSKASTPTTAHTAERFFASCGLHVAWVADAPGLVLGRIVAQIINESVFALSEGVGGAEDIDDGMVLGLNHPRGPLTWADTIGAPHVLAILDALRSELGEERYRAAPLLRRVAADGGTLRDRSG